LEANQLTTHSGSWGILFYAVIHLKEHFKTLTRKAKTKKGARILARFNQRYREAIKATFPELTFNEGWLKGSFFKKNDIFSILVDDLL
jgi:hypothetical protein